VSNILSGEFPLMNWYRAQKLVLDALGVIRVAAVIGGSMGGMLALEFSLCTPPGYVESIVPIATSAYHGAWGISWGETQRQCIYSDSTYQNGWYKPIPSGQPRKGLGAARMVAMLTYRSHFSFEAKFNRKPAGQRKRVSPPKEELSEESGLRTPPLSDDGNSVDQCCGCESHRKLSEAESRTEYSIPAKFAAQTYLQYQAEKFLSRFDANCYVHLTNKMDSHNVVTRERLPSPISWTDKIPDEHELKHVFRVVPPRALVISVETDVLFRPEQQRQLAESLPDARFVNLDSMDGHDGFLLEFEALNDLITDHLKGEHPGLYKADLGPLEDQQKGNQRHDSVFGEAESD
jgi:homoserine O-acetyltransferase